ncbi:MAG TPA: hypothetical protein GX707_11880 [Epulopiscium sp.]|nr:hypothetical protein [Candidatus Epulonipiscium sp.]
MGAFKHHVYGEPESDEDTFVFIDIQAGSNEYQDNRIAIPNVIIKKLGMKDLLMDTQENATLAITKVDNAISRVSAAC